MWWPLLATGAAVGYHAPAAHGAPHNQTTMQNLNIPAFTPNADDTYAAFFNAVVAACMAHPDVFNMVLRLSPGEGYYADGVTVSLKDGSYTADAYAAFSAAVRLLPDALPDGDLALNLFAPKGQPVLKLWHD